MGLLPKRIATSVKNGAGLTETSEVECKYEEPLKNPPYYHKKISSDYPSDESQEPLERWVTEKQNPLCTYASKSLHCKLKYSQVFLMQHTTELRVFKLPSTLDPEIADNVISKRQQSW